MSDGKSYFVSDTDHGEALTEAFQGANTYQPFVYSDNIHVKVSSTSCLATA